MSGDKLDSFMDILQHW